MLAPFESKAALAVDAPLAIAATSIPFWLPSAEEWGKALIVVGGVVLIALRVAIAVVQLRRAAARLEARSDD